MDLARVQAVLLDVDGTLHFKGRALPGAVDLVSFLEGAGLDYRLLTNIDSQTPEAIAADLAGVGLGVPAERVLNPVRALRRFLEEERRRTGRPPSCRFLLSEELVAEFLSCSRPVRDSESPDFVVLGDCARCMAYGPLNTALRDLLAGARLVAMQRGRFYIRADGPHIDTGAFVRALEYAAGTEALLLGKPAPEFAAFALESLGVPGSRVLVVGDDVSTDIPTARAIGATGILVRTGKWEEAQVAAASVRPDAVVDGLIELRRLLEENVLDGGGAAGRGRDLDE